MKSRSPLGRWQGWERRGRQHCWPHQGLEQNSPFTSLPNQRGQGCAEGQRPCVLAESQMHNKGKEKTNFTCVVCRHGYVPPPSCPRWGEQGISAGGPACVFTSAVLHIVPVPLPVQAERCAFMPFAAPCLWHPAWQGHDCGGWSLLAVTLTEITT